MFSNVALGDIAHEGSGYPVLLGDSLLSSSRAAYDRQEYFESLGVGKFCGHTGIAALRCSMSKHVALIISVRVPTKVLDAIVRWVAVVVTHVGLPGLRRREERLCNKPMSRTTIGLAPCFLSKNERDVPKRANRAFQYNRLISDPGLRVPPLSRLSAPRSHVALRRDLIHRKLGDHAPFGIRCIHGC